MSARIGRRPESRRGFTLVEVIIVMAVLATLAAIVYVALPNVTQRGTAASLAQSFDVLRDATLAYRGDIGRYPGELDQLATLPAAGSLDPCDRVIPADFATKWHGPYIDRAVTTAGMPVEHMVIVNDVFRFPATATGYGNVTFFAVPVDTAVAEALEEEFDGTVDFSTGTITFSNAFGGLLGFSFPVEGC